MINNSMGSFEQRKDQRASSEFAVKISVGSQITVQGQLKDISVNSAFIKIKNNIFLNTGDEVGISIQVSPDDAEAVIQGLARVSRIVPGEGLAVYFSKLDDASLKNLKKLLQRLGISS